MQEIRRNSRHRQANKKTQGRLFLGVLFIIGVMVLFWFNLKDYKEEEKKQILDDKDYLPHANKGIIYHKPFYSLSYVEEHEIPEWVAYRLTVDMLNTKKFPRDQDFNPDPEIAEGSAHYHDYKGSGYRRGHLVPSADMAWNKQSMDATFLLSNVAPMREEFNDGIWLELEHNVRDWARRYGNVMVVTGPVLKDSITRIGQNDVFVPKNYFKAIFKVEKSEPEVVGFLFDQTIETELPLENFIVPIDSIEKLTGFDLFENLYGDWENEIQLEKKKLRTEGQWIFNEKWYQERLENMRM